jgi:hypothetical protein
VVHVAPLPNLGGDAQFSLHPERKTSFYQLNRAFDRDRISSGKQHMKMIGHHGELVDEESPLISIEEQSRDQQTSHVVGLKRLDAHLRR